MSYKLPKGYLSPSQLNTWERCQHQYRIFVAEGAKAPPDFGLEVKKQTHETILEGDLKQKIQSKINLPDSHLKEMFRAGLELRAPLAKEDPNMTEPVEKVVEREDAYFGKIVACSATWRKSTMPKSVETDVSLQLGEVPVTGRFDLMADEGVNDRIWDLKRAGQAPSKGAAGKSRQLATYALATGITDVGLQTVKELKGGPEMAEDTGSIEQPLVMRVKAQYEGIAAQISHAIETDTWVPVDTTDKRKDWICTAQYCGAWRIGSKDWKTGRDISCPFGEKAQIRS